MDAEQPIPDKNFMFDDFFGKKEPEKEEEKDSENDHYTQKDEDIYRLDEFLDSRGVNKRLERAPRFKRGEIDFSDYPIEQANINAFKFLHDELMHLRHQVYNYYFKQGYLGRSLIFLVD